MNNVVDRLLEETESDSVLFMEYVNFVPKDSETILCFFEGYDSKYYEIRIRGIHNGKTIISKPCGSKIKLINLFNEINKNAVRKRGIIEYFFVDRDFDDNRDLNDEIYVTNVYSIENYYISDSAMKRILINEFHFDELNMDDAMELNNVLSKIINDRTDFVNNIRDLNVWYMYQKEVINKCRLMIDLSALKEIRRKSLPITLADCKRITNGYVDISIPDYDRIKRYFHGNELKLFRGKYFGEFLHKKLTDLVLLANQSMPPFTRKKSVKLNVGNSTFVGVLSQYADTPECLLKYIQEKCTNI